MMEDATRMEEAARAAMRAAAGTVSDAPPLHLPPLASPAPQRPRRHEPGHRRRRAQWLVPLAAAACVIAIAAGLVAVRQVQNGPASPRPLPSSAMPASAAPDYYVALSHPPDEATPNQVIVGNAATGHILSRVSPPAGTTFSGVAGAADDRTFVLETQPFPQPLPARTITGAGPRYTPTNAAVTLPRTWYLLRVSPSASPAAQLVRIPVPVTPARQEVTALALSPDGSKLALAILPQPFTKGFMGASGTLQLLRVYSVATGAVLRTWSSTKGSIDSYDFTPDSGTTMSWLPDGNHLAVFIIDSDSPGLHLLDVRSPGGDLATAGTRLTTGGISNCSQSPTGYAPLLLAPDGTTLVCGWYDSWWPDSVAPGGFDKVGTCPAAPVVAGIADYSLSAPAAAAAARAVRLMWQPWRASRSLVSFRACDSGVMVMPQLAWSSPDGGEVLAYVPSPGPGWALYRPGGFTRLHVTSVPDPHYVAW